MKSSWILGGPTCHAGCPYRSKETHREKAT